MLLLPLAFACRSTSVKFGDSADADTDADSDTDTDTDTDTDSGTVIEGDLAVTPDAITLPVTFIGQTTSAEVTLQNVGEGTLSATLSFVGGWATNYTLDSYTATLAGGESSVHTLTLTPTDWGDHSVGLLVDTDTDVHVEVPVTASVQEDADGDGYGSTESGGDDCDDADPAINPGAPDTWYDGIDSDCAGNDDYDQDADNFVPDEYFGLPTDGVLGSGRLRGGDCDDADSAVNPNAYDTWYDGIDSDCAGNDDYDQDGDGFDTPAGGGDDCDDTDASVYVGAPDTWYDGVDSDCAGDDDYDQDLDGVDYPDDCNDTDPTVTGPTAETWNGVDDDCNGYVDDFVIDDAATGALYGYTGSLALGDHGELALADDVTGDGLPDLLAATRASGYGYAWVVDGAAAAAANGDIRNYDTAVVSGDSSYYPIYAVNGPWADVDGDGTTDFVIGGESSSYSYGRSYLFEGGSSVTGAISASTYDARYVGDNSSDDSCMSALADIDGDGLGDAVVGSANDNSPSQDDAGSVAVFLGGGSGEQDLGDSDDRIYGSDENDYLGASLTAADVDGDGYADFVVGAPGYNGTSNDIGAVYVVLGNASGAWGPYIDDAATGWVTGTSRDVALGEDTLAHPGDLDGDGSLDLALGSEAEGSVWVFLDAASIGADERTSAADHVLTGTPGDFGSMVVQDSDLDGDGADDLVVGADGDDTNGSNSGSVFVFTVATSWAATLTEADANASLWGGSANGYLGTGGAGGADLDGDGREDVVIGSASNDDLASDAGAVFVVPGW